MKHILITGGTGGIGKFISKALIEDGYYLSIVGRKQKKFNFMIDEMEIDKNIQFIKADVSDHLRVIEIYNELSLSEYQLYGLINMAGVQAPIGEFIDNDMDEWSNNLFINLFGTANMIHGFLNINSQFKQKRKIINFSGGGATSLRTNLSAYSISKIGVVKFTEILASELSNKNLDINAIAPGAINTGMLQEIIDAGQLAGDEYNIAVKTKIDGGESINKTIDLCRFLLSTKSNGISGKLISAVWDKYNEKDFLQKLKNDKDFCTLRRIDQLNYFKK